jgi:tubulin polyglutamylase TTLL6/13
MIIKTFISVQPILTHSYRACYSDIPDNNVCFELLGFDILIDSNLKPWLLEVNHTPSFATETQFDEDLKY